MHHAARALKTFAEVSDRQVIFGGMTVATVPLVTSARAQFDAPPLPAAADPAAAEAPYRRRGERHGPTMMASVAAHVAVMALVVFVRPPAPLDLTQQPVIVRMVALGEKRPEHLLPRKLEESPPAAKAGVGLGPPVARGTAGGATQRGDRDVLAQVMSRLQSTVPEGSADGDPLRTERDGDVADRYLAQVTRALQETYTLPSTLSERERMYLQATVLLFIEPDGRISRWQFAQRSQNAVFDAALERAVQQAALPPPPSDLAPKYREQGLAVRYRP